MLSNRLLQRILWVIVLAAAVGLLILSRELWEPPPAVLQVEAVALERDAQGQPKLSISVKGLHEGVRAMLFPEQERGEELAASLQLPATLYNFAVDGRLAVVTTNDHRLLTLETGPGGVSRILGGFQLLPVRSSVGDMAVNGISLHGTRALVARSSVGLILVDLAEPSQPREIDRIALVDQFTELVDNGQVAYGLGQASGLVMIRVDGSRLHLHRFSGSQGAWRLAVGGRRLVTASHDGMLNFYDLDPGGVPHPAGSIKLTKKVRDLAVVGETLYLASADGLLLSYPLSSWPQLAVVGALDLNGRPLRLEPAPDGRRLFCTLTARGVAVIELDRAATPRLAGLIPMPKIPTAMQSDGERLFTVGIEGLRSFSADMLDRLSVAPENLHPFDLVMGKVRLLPWQGQVFAYDLQQLARILAPGTGGATTARQSAAPTFLALPDVDGIRLHAIRGGEPELLPSRRLDIVDREREKHKSRIPLIRDVAWHGDRLYVLSFSLLQIFEGSLLDAEKPLGVYEPPGETSAMAWLPPHYMVVASRTQGYMGFEVIDVSAPSQPRRVASRAIPRHQRKVGDIGGLLCEGQRLYVSRSRLGVEVYDLSDPANPRLTQRIDTPGSAERMALADGLLAVGNQDQGVFVIDVHGAYALPVGSYRLPLIVHDLLIHDRQLFVTNAAGEVLRFPLPLRLDPARVAVAHAMPLTIPAGTLPGRYLLTLYDGDNRAEAPVMLQ